MNQLKEIMSAVGRKRFIILAILAVVCLGLGGAWQKMLLPQHQKLKAELSQVQGERSRLQTEISELPLKHADLETSEKRYIALQQRGFFASQDRIEARTRINILRDQSKLYSISYKIEPLEIMENSSFSSETEQIVMSKVNVEIHSMTDLEALDFVERMQAEFSGLVVLKDLSLKRVGDASAENLQKLSKGEAVELVSGEASFAWYSIVPKASALSSPQSQDFEGSLK